ncbi:uncharacterized protein LOC127258182 [Andrographis paniculata]|uniref:uncharacterized protein LOC127258182 n=1 Tax=Andrographis paniculata TaxID=175694 RepID=UPI0021E7B062|nr:uncharacterized protein LOC127258182 [Andrographis paniculata]XP_051140872.1 uncharacterized protein LOC127258182 [Andrographis paniculata]XP_051140873.1 uncharacterized protein LOC127258182 [Andrographis paniculata]
MSGEGFDSPVTPEKLKLERRNINNIAAEKSVPPSHGSSSSARAFHHKTSNGSSGAMRYSSAGKSDSFSSNQNVMSRYLRASTGSCHDFCKHGTRHESEDPVRTPWRRRCAMTTTLLVEQSSLQTMDSDGDKNLKAFSRKTASNARARSPYLKTSSETKSPSPKSTMSLDRGQVVKHKASTRSASDLRKPRASSEENTSSSRPNQTNSPKNKPSSTKEGSSQDPHEMIKSVSYPSEANASQGLGKKTSRHSSLKSSHPKPSFASKKSDIIRGKESKHGDAETGRNKDERKASGTKILVSLGSSSSPNLSVDNTASSRSRKAGNLKSASSPNVCNIVGGDHSNTPDGEKASENNIFDDSMPDDLYTESRSHAESPSLLSPEEDKKEIEYHDGEEENKEIFEKDESLVISTAQAVPIDNAVSTCSSPLSTESQSRPESSSSSLSPCEENKEVKHIDDEAGESIINNGESLEIEKIQPVLDLPTVSSSPESSSHAESSSPSPHEEEIKEIDYLEDELHEYISENDDSPSSPSSLSSHDDDEDNDEIEYGNGNNEAATKEDDLKKTFRKSGGAAISDDNHRSPPVKLKFKPGRIVDVQSDNNVPRRLKFRRAKDIGAEHRKDRARTTRKSGGSGGDVTAAGDESSQKVVLKHQDVNDKKESPVLLLNNVIEETASKLVESRKSKVKALVGAFETVISLHETKPSS